jgi:hypothetical protein
MAVWGRLTSATDWIEKYTEGVQRLAKLESFERQLFVDLGWCYHPDYPKDRSIRLRILGWDEPEFHVDGLLDTVQREIGELRRCLPLWEENARLQQATTGKMPRDEHIWKAPANKTIPRAVREWIDATTPSEEWEPEAA